MTTTGNHHLTPILNNKRFSKKNKCRTVVQVVQHLLPGGLETMVLDLSNDTEQNQHTLIVSLEGRRDSALQRWPKLADVDNRLFFLNKKPGIELGLVFKLAKLFKQHDVDVVHTHHIGPLLYAGVAARLAGVAKVIHTEHDAWHLDERGRCVLQRLCLYFVRPRLVADSNCVADIMREKLGNRNITTIRNGVDTTRFLPGDQQQARRHFGLPERVCIVGCSGRLEPVKDQSTLIKALHYLPADTHIALAGSGSTEAELKRQVQRLGVESRVHFLGHIENMPRFYQALNVFCLPSLNEGFPLSPLEAQACGVPTVVTDVGGCKETLCHDTGAIVPCGNALALAFAVQRLLQHPRAISPANFVRRQCDLKQMKQAYRLLA